MGRVAPPHAAVAWRDPDSPLCPFQRMLDTLRECAEVGVGDHEVIGVGLPQIRVHRDLFHDQEYAHPPSTVSSWPVRLPLDPARRKALFGQPSREPPSSWSPRRDRRHRTNWMEKL